MAKAEATAGESDTDGAAPRAKRLPKKRYAAELLRLQGRLVEMQEWVKTSGTRLVVVFEGRDAAGKGGTIQRMVQYLNPRVCRIVALPAPTERQRTQWYFQRYVEHLPAAGEIVLFDRSWYNRGGVERVLGFATPAEYQRSCASARPSSGCWSRTGSCCASTGSPSATPSRSDASAPGSRTH